MGEAFEDLSLLCNELSYSFFNGVAGEKFVNHDVTALAHAVDSCNCSPFNIWLELWVLLALTPWLTMKKLTTT